MGMHGISNRDTHLYSPHNNHQFIWQQQQKCGGLGGSLMFNAEWLDNTRRLRNFIPNIGTNTSGMTLPGTAWVQLNRVRTSVSCLPKSGMASSATCESGAEQTVDHVALQYPIRRPPHGLTIDWLLNTCPEI